MRFKNLGCFNVCEFECSQTTAVNSFKREVVLELPSRARGKLSVNPSAAASSDTAPIYQLPIPQISDGPFSAVSKPIFATKYSFCSVFQDLQNELAEFSKKIMQFFSKIFKFCKISLKFSDFCKFFLNFRFFLKNLAKF